MSKVLLIGGQRHRTLINAETRFLRETPKDRVRFAILVSSEQFDATLDEILFNLQSETYLLIRVNFWGRLLYLYLHEKLSLQEFSEIYLVETGMSEQLRCLVDIQRCWR
jgi:hypothetical protein